MQICYFWGTKIENDTTAIIEAVAKMGADFIELNPSVFLNIKKEERDTLKKRITNAGLSVTVNGSMMNSMANLSSANPKTVKAGLDLCRMISSGCADLGSPIWTGLIHGLWNSKPNLANLKKDICETRSRSIEGLKAAVKIAAEYNIVYCLEVVNRYEMFYLNTAADAVDFCEKVNSPYCKVLLDVFHMYIEENNTAEAISFVQKKGLLQGIHIGETNRRIPIGGKSNVDWHAVVATICDSGFTGPLTLEPFEFSNAKNAGAVCTWRNHEDPTDLDRIILKGKQGIDFIRNI
jgi:D-psicose/D-tagatose/L-ribulose 3-epimerase